MIESKSIGKYVWRQLDKWVSQTKADEDLKKWNESSLAAIEQELLDYYLLVIEKPF